MELLDERRCRDVIQRAAAPFYRGRIDVVSGVLVEAVGVPAAMGELCRVELGRGEALEAEVIGFRGDRTLLMPPGDLVGLSPGQPVQLQGYDERPSLNWYARQRIRRRHNGDAEWMLTRKPGGNCVVSHRDGDWALARCR